MNFDKLARKIMEDLSANVAGSGGVLGTFNTNNWTAGGTPGTDSYASGDYRRPVALGAKKTKKKKLKIPIMRRKLS
jgi:hypothetical protein